MKSHQVRHIPIYKPILLSSLNHILSNFKSNALWWGTVLKNDGTVKDAVRWVRWYGPVGTVVTVRWVRWVRYGGYGTVGTVGTV